MNKLVSVRPVLVCPPDAAPLVARAAQVFAEEILLHTGLRLATSACPVGGVEMAAILTEADFCRLFPEKVALLERLPAPGPEGFRLFFEQEDGVRLNLFAVGCDPRGAFYAMGKLLRMLRLHDGRICADWLFDGLSSTPRYAMRGLSWATATSRTPCPAGPRPSSTATSAIWRSLAPTASNCSRPARTTTSSPARCSSIPLT